MGQAVQFGDVVITDVNYNDHFDSKIDLVTNTSGKLFDPKDQAKKLKAVLKELGASSWKQLPLGQASSYFFSIGEAERHSHLGLVESVEELIKNAKDDAVGLPLSFDQARADTILTRALA